MKNLILFLPFFFLLSCQQKEGKNSSVNIPDSTLTREKKIVDKESESVTEINKQEGDTILMQFKDEKGAYVAEGAIDSIHSKVYVKFSNEEMSELNAKIVPTTGKGNIRFNQIVFPDKTMDGPFGMDLKIDLKQKGNYLLIIGHSQMADNPYVGNFKVQIENKKE